MSNKNISGLAAATLPVAGTELLAVWDASGTTKSVSIANLVPGLTGVVTLTGTQELTNKTLTSSVAKGTWTASGIWTLPSGTTLVAPVLGTPASGTVTNLTGTASININGTVGATTPTTGAFTSLNATGLLTQGNGAKFFTKEAFVIASIPATSGTETIAIVFGGATSVWFSGELTLLGHASSGVASRVATNVWRFWGYLASNTYNAGAGSGATLIGTYGHEIGASVALTIAATGSGNSVTLTLTNTYGDVFNDGCVLIDILANGAIPINSIGI